MDTLLMDFLSGLGGSLVSAIGSIFGGSQAQKEQEKINAQNIAMQEQFAQQGLQWRAADATAAQDQTGINRLALLGVPTTSFSNVVGSDALGRGIADAGQSVGRAVAAMAPTQMRNAELQNKLLEAKIRNTDADTVASMKRNSDVATTLGQPGTAPGIPLPRPAPWIELTQLARTADGRIIRVPSEKAASPLQTLGALPTNLGMAMQDFLGPIVETGNRLHEASPSWDALYGQAKRAVQDYSSRIFDRNTSGY